MNSKEAFQLVSNKVRNTSRWYEDELKLIQQDLDRLEKLEKAINILKNKTVVIVALKLSKNLNDYNRMTTFKNLTQEEYELLKEVLEND